MLCYPITRMAHSPHSILHKMWRLWSIARLILLLHLNQSMVKWTTNSATPSHAIPVTRLTARACVPQCPAIQYPHGTPTWPQPGHFPIAILSVCSGKSHKKCAKIIKRIMSDIGFEICWWSSWSRYNYNPLLWRVLISPTCIGWMIATSSFSWSW